MTGLIPREQYMKLLRAGRDLTDVVKVVTGMRRSGKSTLLEMYIEELVASGVPRESVVMINFETFQYRDICKRDQLDPLLIDMIGEEGFKYVFLDEIQNVEGWEESVSSLLNTRRCDVYITGSNSKLLSSEIATHISGRHVEVAVLPLSFAEYLELHPGDEMRRFAEFIRYGGLPEVDPSRGEEFCDMQLRGLFNTVLVEDILSRMGKGSASTLISIARFLYSNIGNETSVDGISKDLDVSNDTVKRYLAGLKGALLFHEAEKYDIVGRKLLKTNGKLYASDLGLRHAALLGAGGTDISRPIENVVYLELVRRGYTVRVGSYRGWEVDFTATRNGRVEYFQVCQTMMSRETAEREVRPLKRIDDNFPKTVITLDVLGLGSDEGVEVVNLLDWLLGRS